MRPHSSSRRRFARPHWFDHRDDSRGTASAEQEKTTMKTLGIAIVMMVASTAFADESVRGDKAANLVRAIKFAGVKPTTAKGARTFKVAALHCWSSKEGTDEQLGDYKCSLDKLEVKDGLALLLQTAMEGAGIPSDNHMSQHTTDAKTVTCVIDPAKSGDDRFTCNYAKK